MDWTRGYTIGHGSTATVSVATGNTGVFAVKSVELAKSEFLQREQKILSILSSPHIVEYKGYDITMENNNNNNNNNKQLMFNLMMVYFPHGTISDAIRRSGAHLEEEMICCYTRQIVQGLEYLHSSGIVHCDIKGSNILVSETFGAKIADFGCAKWSNSAVVVGGTPMFMAPEVARGEEQGFGADIWALGCTIIEMATGSAPWPNVTNVTSLIYKIGFSQELPEIPEFLSDQAKDFLNNCLRRDPNERWTADQLLNHPFLLDISKGNDEKENHEITSSPTSILDKGIWNSMEESETISGIITNNSSNSPVKRLEELKSKSGKPNWKWEESWIEVRRSRGNEDADEMVVCLSLAGSASHGIEVECSTADDNSMVIFLDENIISKNRFNDTIISTKCIDERFVNSNLNFERYRKKQKLNPIHFL